MLAQRASHGIYSWHLLTAPAGCVLCLFQDRDRLLAIIESAFGDFFYFNELVRNTFANSEQKSTDPGGAQDVDLELRPPSEDGVITSDNRTSDSDQIGVTVLQG